MNRREFKAALAARKKAARASLAEAKRRARAAVDQDPKIRRARRLERLRRALTVVVVLLLLSLIHCECGPAEPAPVVAVEAKPPQPKVVVKPKVKPVKPGPLAADMTKQPRPTFVGQGVGAPTWLDEFRLQVSARSVRLATCFNGVERPGALRWVSSVNPTSGTVSDHEFEPIGFGNDLTPEQLACVTGVLKSPVYKLTEPNQNALPNRISLVIEF